MIDYILEIKNLNFKYEEKEIFTNLNLILEYNKWYSLVGNNGSGKTTLIKIIGGLLKLDEGITFNFLSQNLKNIFDIRKKLSIIFDDIDSMIICDNVYDEVTFELENIGLSSNEIKQLIDEIDEITHIKDLFNCDINNLTEAEKYRLILTTALIKKPKLLILDNILSKTSIQIKKMILEAINKYKENDKLTVLNITNNMEETLIGDNIILLENKEIKFNKPVKEVYDDKLLNPDDAPFVVRLSEYLKLYELIDKNYYSFEDLVEEIWK